MERFFKKPHTVAALRCAPLSSFLDEIAQELQDEGYAASTARFQLVVASDFSAWLERESHNNRNVFHDSTLPPTCNTGNSVRKFMPTYPWMPTGVR